MIEVLILSFIQGVTEFIPVSSSSHLILISNFLDFDDKGLAIDVSLHIGSFLGILFYFRKDIFNFFQNKELFYIILKLLLIVGFLLTQTNIIDKIRNIEVIAWTTIIFGVLLYFSDKFKLNNKLEKNFSIKSAIIIGVFQILSLVPGVSRSGITITAARILNFNRLDSAKISFLMSIPTLGAVSIFGLNNIITSPDINFSILNFISIFFSFLFSLLTIKYFLGFLKKFNLNFFVFYRITLGVILLFIASL